MNLLLAPPRAENMRRWKVLAAHIAMHPVCCRRQLIEDALMSRARELTELGYLDVQIDDQLGMMLATLVTEIAIHSCQREGNA